MKEGNKEQALQESSEITYKAKPPLHDEWLKESRRSLDAVRSANSDVDKKVDGFLRIVLFASALIISFWPDDLEYDLNVFYVLLLILAVFVIMLIILSMSWKYEYTNVMDEVTKIYLKETNEINSYWRLVERLDNRLNSDLSIIKKKSSMLDFLYLLLMIILVLIFLLIQEIDFEYLVMVISIVIFSIVIFLLNRRYA